MFTPPAISAIVRRMESTTRRIQAEFLDPGHVLATPGSEPRLVEKVSPAGAKLSVKLSDGTTLLVGRTETVEVRR